MVLRALALTLGLLELVAPRAVVNFWMGLASDDDVELKPWVYTVARVEGLLFVAWALTRGRVRERDAPDGG